MQVAKYTDCAPCEFIGDRDNSPIRKTKTELSLVQATQHMDGINSDAYVQHSNSSGVSGCNQHVGLMTSDTAKCVKASNPSAFG